MPQGLGPTNRYVLAGHHVTSHAGRLAAAPPPFPSPSMYTLGAQNRTLNNITLLLHLSPVCLMRPAPSCYKELVPTTLPGYKPAPIAERELSPTAQRKHGFAVACGHC